MSPVEIVLIVLAVLVGLFLLRLAVGLVAMLFFAAMHRRQLRRYQAALRRRGR